MIEIVYRVALVLLAIGTTFFPIYYQYSSRGDWRLTPMGRHLMGYTASAALLADAGIVRVYLPDLFGQELIRTLALGLAVLFVWQRNYIAVKAQRVEGTQTDERFDEESD